MQRRHRNVSMALAFASILIDSGAKADGRNPFKVRCDNDHMVPGAQVGRNSWAHKCGYIAVEERDFQNAHGYYVTFMEKVAPLDGNAPCEGGLTAIGWCAAAGCYTPDQKVHFGARGDLPIADAAMAGVDVVSGFSASWMLGDAIALTDERVGSYTVGDQFAGVLAVTTQTGKRIEVTDNHPLVSADGHVVQAGDILPGTTQLLTVDGPERVASLQLLSYVGKVWNLEPESTATNANLHVAEGFVSGSVRYQNEWADDAHRRSLRSRVDTSDF